MWAAAAKKELAPPPPPTPEKRLKVLADFYSNKTEKAILLEALGAKRDPMDGMPAIAIPLVEHMITICIDTESWTNNTDIMTELGMDTFSRRKGREINTTTGPGPHGVNIMKALDFHHFRIAENAHLLSNRQGSYGPLGNRFGKTRFVTFKELRVVLDHFFNQDIVSDDPELQGCKRPVILVGHALRHDLENVNKEGLEYNFTKYPTIVAKVDTQPLARQTKVWIPQDDMKTNEIGLRVLIEEKIGFLHLDDHTASNDAARTMMCGIWMCLPPAFTSSQSQTMQQVANDVEKHSSLYSEAPYGSVHCCVKCGGRDHSAAVCSAVVQCAACYRFDSGPNRDENVASHVETYCPHVAVFKAWARRYRDAWLKNRQSGRPFSTEVLAGCGPDAHPYSTWRKSAAPHWPLKHLNEVLEGMAMSTPPAPFVYNLQAALGGLQVPSGGDWVMDLGQTSPNGTTAGLSSATGRASDALSMVGVSSVLPASGSTVFSGAFPALVSSSNAPVTAPPGPVWPPAATASAVPARVSPAVIPASAPPASGAAHEVVMSTSRGSGRGNRDRGNAHAGRGRGASGVSRGNGGAGAGAGSDPSWDPSNVW